ncbi:uncharacterized protein LOC126857522 isoform X2 [Cataglyphis hispanica]|uniref:uncharacterized protein LOC126857522 isoform X2 n=1 Tax=Cataglyphis hispanica TaxID=1086592 RepID=UPI002180385B|nr:uncharacterized protein LOC126857522 isoform X2 [Cataglyphis hispanica]
MSAEATTVLLKKRERTQNWIPEEKNALFTLIKHHVNAIENKKIDAAASAMKSLAWQQIYCAFRGRFSADRDITRIREQWRRMKAQARMEMYTYAEKVRTLGPEAAVKSQPSNLSIEVWRLMESVRKNDCEADRSDDSSQDNENPTNRTAIHAILDKLTLPTPETSGWPFGRGFRATPRYFRNYHYIQNYRDDYLGQGHEIKIEVNSDTEDENSRGELSQKLSDDSFLPQNKRSRIATEDEPVDLVEQKTTCPDSVSTSRIDDERNDARNELSSASVGWNNHLVSSDKDKSVQRAMWIFKSTQREHEIKLRMLHIELERAELQKQTAINELKTSEIKKQLMEDQAAEYYSHVRMSGERGSGAGKGGGGGGAIRDAGGSFGKMEAAHEDQYFYNLQKEQLQKMRESLHDEISFHEEQIKRHQEAINRHKKRITDMERKE